MSVARIGFIGTGTITEAMVTGLMSQPAVANGIIISPRNAGVAARLVARFPDVIVAGYNQCVVDAADLVVLAVRPQIAGDVVRDLLFRRGQTVVSVIAAVDRETLLEWIAEDVQLVQAVPLPFVAHRQGVTTLYPPDDTVAALFSTLGTAIACETREEYDLLAAASAVMGTYFGILETAIGWLGEKGLPASKATAYLVPLFASLSQTAVDAKTADIQALRHEFSTRGGLNEQVFDDFTRKGGPEALTAALDRVLTRIKG